MNREELNNNPAGVVLRTAKAQGIVMSRVPKPTRDRFVDLAENEFAGDYGLLLKHLFDTYELWVIFMNNWDLKLDYILTKLDEKEPQVEKPRKTRIRMLGGNSIEKEERE